MKNKILFTIIILLYIIVPLTILYIPPLFKYKFYILTIIGLLIYLLFRINKASNKSLGITKENAIKSLKRNFPLIIIGIITIIILKIFNLNKYIPNETIAFYLFYIFLSCPIQEFLYRGIFGYFENTLVKNKFLMLFLSSFCYSFVHIIYKDLLTCLLTFLIGLIWYHLYRKDFNLLGVSLSHIIIGLLTIYFGIIN